MLKEIHLEYFKCFRKLNLPLSNLTLLSGINSAGKSSVIQALVLLHQEINNNDRSKKINLNGDCIKLGTASDIIDEIYGKDKINISLKYEDVKIEWDMFCKNKSELNFNIEHIHVQDIENKIDEKIITHNTDRVLNCLIPYGVYEKSKSFKNLANTLKNLSYICAERFGPKEYYSVFSEDDIKNVGVSGEKASWFLFKNRDKTPLKKLIIPDVTQTLFWQVKAWMNRFFPGADFEIKQIERTNLVSLGLKSKKEENFHRAQNVGFGYMQVFPILVNCLAAVKGQLLIIENPESHLHPSGQSLMGEFLSLCASSGVQIILESHSDHILNGIRKSVKNKILKPEQTEIHFFQKRDEKFPEKNQVKSPLMNSKGNLDFWPKGFFDQFDIDTENLIDWGN